jgi:hypothetical protein
MTRRPPTCAACNLAHRALFLRAAVDPRVAGFAFELVCLFTRVALAMISSMRASRSSLWAEADLRRRLAIPHVMYLIYSPRKGISCAVSI